ncbi:unnamed protein product [Schistocephalus solidus]|uniref:NTF2 domain-containing protein n=1 Tax=Schistocephalus solidus TaxID=70667 RepID=A0A183TQF5_SCHSO|nr:unnamed protein product [Schistocephalus solidus]
MAPPLLSESARTLLTVVCQHFDITEKHEFVLADLGVRNGGADARLVERLFQKSYTPSSISSAITYVGVAFYKEVTYEKKLFRIKVTPGTAILRVSSRNEESTAMSLTATGSSGQVSEPSEPHFEVVAMVKEPEPDLDDVQTVSTAGESENSEEQPVEIDKNQYVDKIEDLHSSIDEVYAAVVLARSLVTRDDLLSSCLFRHLMEPGHQSFDTRSAHFNGNTVLSGCFVAVQSPYCIEASHVTV